MHFAFDLKTTFAEKKVNHHGYFIGPVFQLHQFHCSVKTLGWPAYYVCSINYFWGASFLQMFHNFDLRSQAILLKEVSLTNCPPPFLEIWINVYPPLKFSYKYSVHKSKFLCMNFKVQSHVLTSYIYGFYVYTCYQQPILCIILCIKLLHHMETSHSFKI